MATFMPGRRWRGGLGPRETMVPLNSCPIVMGRVSLVMGWGFTGEKLVDVRSVFGFGESMGRVESVLWSGEVFM